MFRPKFLKVRFHMAMAAALSLSLMSVPMPVVASGLDDDGASLTLKAAASRSDFIADGAAWSCSGTTCSSSHVSGQPAIYACMHVVEILGPIESFTYQGESLSADKLAKCNARAHH